MKPWTTRLLFLFFAIASTGIVQAREKLVKTSAVFFCLRYVDELQDIHVRTGANRYAKVELSTSNMVGPVQLVASDGEITLHRKNPTGGGHRAYPVIGRVQLGTIRQPLLILVPGPDKDKDKDQNEASYETHILDRAVADFPLGSMQLLNLSAHPVRGQVGEASIEVEPSKAAKLQPEDAEGKMMDVLFEYKDGTLWRPMTKTRWTTRPDRRSLLVAYLDPRSKRVKMRTIPERIAPAAPDR